MSDPQIHALATQVQSISSQILNESNARLMADAALAERVGSLENLIESAKLNMGSIQSTDYVQGMSGLKIDFKTGNIELNSCTLGSFKKSPERQLVSVEVASWSKYDLPKNAANLLQFMQAELQKVPEQYRHTAEFEEFDASYGDESFSARLFLSYSRLETEEELADRLEKANLVGVSRVSIKDGVISVSHDGVLTSRLAIHKAPDEPEQLNGGSVDAAIEKMARVMGNTELASELLVNVGQLNIGIAGEVRGIIRDELKPGGMLHKFS